MPPFQSDLFINVYIKSYLKVGGGSLTIYYARLTNKKFKGNGKSECFLF